MNSDKYTLARPISAARKTISTSDLTGAMLAGPMWKDAARPALVLVDLWPQLAWAVA